MQFPADLCLSPDGCHSVVSMHGQARTLDLPSTLIVQVKVVDAFSLVQLSDEDMFRFFSSRTFHFALMRI